MKLWAISDLHIGHDANWRALQQLPAHPDDWLILGGDVCETGDDLRRVIELLTPRFARLIWIPGNHELWSTDADPRRGDEKYRALVELCRQHDVLTPQDPYAVWEGDGGPHIIAPLFLLYDYSFAPDGMTVAEAIDWAAETKIRCADERLLHPDPFPSRQAWCAERLRLSAERLDRAVATHQHPTVLINHFPLLRSHAVLPLIPRFSVWCGTRLTDDWHRRYHASVVVYGHLHIPTTRYRAGTRFEEVSLGYPQQRGADQPIHRYLRQILPAPEDPRISG